MKKTTLFILVLFAFANAFAQNRAGAALITERLEKFSSNTTSKNTSVPDCNLNEEAKRHAGRAEGFRVAAKKDEDYLDVFNEYKAAFEYASNCPFICYNVAYSAEMYGKVNPSYCDIAIEYYKKYLQINPNATDINEVEMKIYGVEAEKEKYGKKEMEERYELVEKWIGKWDEYTTIINGNNDIIDNHTDDIEIFFSDGTLKTKQHLISTIYLDNSDLTSKIQSEYQDVPISVDNGFISFSFSTRSKYIGGTLDGNVSNNHYTYKLTLVSKDKLEGTRCDKFGSWNIHLIRE